MGAQCLLKHFMAKPSMESAEALVFMLIDDMEQPRYWQEDWVKEEEGFNPECLYYKHGWWYMMTSRRQGTYFRVEVYPEAI